MILTKKRITSFIFIILLCRFSACATLQRTVDKIIQRADQKKTDYSIHIVSAKTGKELYSHQSSKALVPASNMKVIISAAALKYLGPDFQYTTQVGLAGNNIVIIGSGDPLLGDKTTDQIKKQEAGWIFKAIAQALKNKRISELNDVIVDSSIFDDNRIHPNWPKSQLNRWYACEVAGLNYNGNCIEITAENSSSRISLLVEPETHYVKMLNQIKPITNGKGAIGTYRNNELNKITVYGKCRKKQGPIDVAIERPAAFFGFLLVENLSTEGIRCKGKLLEMPIGDKKKQFKVLTEFNHSLTECIARCNKDSFGLAADSLLKTMAAYASPDKTNGTWENGRRVIENYLLSLGVNKDEFYIDDGRGLSDENKLSARAITAVLQDTYKSKSWNIYRDSLAVGGIDGTIKKYFKEDKYKGRILGKTGFINSVKSFSGVCETDNGDIIFSIIANKANWNTRPAINDIAEAIIDCN